MADEKTGYWVRNTKGMNRVVGGKAKERWERSQLPEDIISISVMRGWWPAPLKINGVTSP